MVFQSLKGGMNKMRKNKQTRESRLTRVCRNTGIALASLFAGLGAAAISYETIPSITDVGEALSGHVQEVSESYRQWGEKYNEMLNSGSLRESDLNASQEVSIGTQ